MAVSVAGLRGVAITAALVLAPPLANAQHGAQHMHQRFQNAEHWSRVFDDPSRAEWQKPDDVVRALALAADAVVADIGSGTGYFAVRLARAVPRGIVYGADVEPDMVKFLEERAAKESLANLRALRAAPDDPRLPAPVDLALFVDTVHHIEARVAYFARLRTYLKPGGRVAIVDFRLDSPTGPPPRHRLPETQVRAELERAGYRLAGEHAFLPYQYFLVFE